MIRSIAAVLGGFLAMAIVVMIGTMAAAAALIPGGMSSMRDGTPGHGVPVRYLVANLTISLLAAILGGYLAARIAGSHPVAHALVLAALVMLLSIASSPQGATGGQPSWYPRTIALIGVAGVLIGGVLLAPR